MDEEVDMTVKSCGVMSQCYIIVALIKNQDMTAELRHCPEVSESNHRVRTLLVSHKSAVLIVIRSEMGSLLLSMRLHWSAS